MRVLNDFNEHAHLQTPTKNVNARKAILSVYVTGPRIQEGISMGVKIVEQIHVFKLNLHHLWQLVIISSFLMKSATRSVIQGE